MSKAAHTSNGIAGSLADGWCRCGAVLRCRVKRSGSLTRREVKPMRVLTFASLLLCSLCFIAKGDAQSPEVAERDRKSTRLNSSHGYISYAVFCLKKKNED